MDLRDSIAHQTAFSLRLASHVSSRAAAESNLVFSPLSLHVALGLVAAGARGPTLDQIASFLAGSKGPAAADAAGEIAALSSQVVEVVLADGSATGGPRLSFANGVWFDASLSLKPSFEGIVTSVYKAETKTVDFQTKAAEVTHQVNSWVESATAGLIKEVLPVGSVDRSTRLVLSNALYFKGAWTEKFDASETKEDEFHLLSGSIIQVPFMSSGKDQLLSSYNDFKVLRLPYKQGEDRRQFSMYIYLPEAKDGLMSFIEKLSSHPEFLDRHLPRQKVSVGKFKVPKFKINFGFEASELLKGLGLVLPFSNEGDLGEMVDSHTGDSLSVSSIFHKSFIEVNEEGTEAAAASAAVVKLRGLPMKPLDFVADHPFVFLIREDMTGTVLFVGHVLNPLAAE
ncbi:serpin-ZXA [Typha angustifolia]|uniref:serpin-ZXA n=1 Tax=Typha angustifolia TaxID=59011 RepID=UPI003C2FB863